MIYTVTLDPVLDRVVWVEELVYDDVNYINEDLRRPLGKGIDVSRVAKELGLKSVALGFAGGYTGMELRDLLDAEDIVTDFTRVKNETRSSLTIYQQKKKIQTLLCTPQPAVSEAEIEAFFKKTAEIPKGSSVVLIGNIPAGLNDDIFARLIAEFKSRDIKVFFDSDGEALKLGVQAGPYMVKPNIFEFNRLASTNASDIKEIAEAVKPFRDMVEYIIVSLGARGAVGFSREGNYHVVPPKVKIRNSTGAGDSLLGGVVSTMNTIGSFERALKIGVACGTAKALGISGSTVAKSDVESIEKEVIIEKF
ncbi:MAG: 1-phosphofructokinase family hexose kinase [Syntrophorhabdaceae bacterium]